MDFSGQIHSMRARIEELRQSAGQSVTLAEVFEELQATLDQMSEAAEALTSQNEACASNLQLLESERRQGHELLQREQAARLEAEAATRAKDQFLATVSHEIRTPLNAILGWTHILQSAKTDKETLIKGLQVIERNAYSQAQIISDLLDISRIVAGTLHLEMIAVDLASIVLRSVEMMRPVAAQKGIEITTGFTHDDQQITGDPDRLQQIVLNLLSNAIKFTPEAGQIEIRLETEGDHIRLTVSDTGIGIAPDFMPFVFDRFSQGDAETTRKIGGLGIGLSIVRHLAQMHGCKVEALSAGLDRGATFIVTFPTASEVEETFERPEQVAAVEPASVQESAISLVGINVLAVDDEADAREMLGLVLKDLGAQVVLAESCGDALKIIKESDEAGPTDARLDIIVADIAMPGEDGFDLIRQVRDLPKDRGGNIPAVALTAYAGAEDRQRIMLSGFQDHLPKPVSLSELAQVVSRLAGRR